MQNRWIRMKWLVSGWKSKNGDCDRAWDKLLEYNFSIFCLNLFQHLSSVCVCAIDISKKREYDLHSYCDFHTHHDESITFYEIEKHKPQSWTSTVWRGPPVTMKAKLIRSAPAKKWRLACNELLVLTLMPLTSSSWTAHSLQDLSPCTQTVDLSISGHHAGGGGGGCTTLPPSVSLQRSLRISDRSAWKTDAESGIARLSAPHPLNENSLQCDNSLQPSALSSCSGGLSPSLCPAWHSTTFLGWNLGCGRQASSSKLLFFLTDRNVHK